LKWPGQIRGREKEREEGGGTNLRKFRLLDWYTNTFGTMKESLKISAGLSTVYALD
jgi:hypothetical protein